MTPERNQPQEIELRFEDRWREVLAAEDPSSGVTSRSLFHRPRAAIGAPAGVVPAELVRHAGDELGEYLLLRLVGIGGMGQVWQARDLELGRTVALKVIRPELMSDQMVDLFRREAKASGRLLHPNIVTVLGVGQEGDVRWIVQEFVEGECTLDNYLQEARTEELPQDYDRRMALFFYQVADALVAAHRAGVVHRDVKPANIMIQESGRPKLTDFGLARLRGEETARGLTGLGGTPGFMSPEQADPTSEHDAGAPATDIFSLGATLYQALHFERPFGDGSAREVVRRTLEVRVQRPAQLRSAVHADLVAICAKALEKHPADRYSDMRALRDDLANVLDGRRVTAHASGPARRGLTWLRRNRRKAAIASGAVISVLLLVWLSGQLSGARRDGLASRSDLHVLRAQRALELGHVSTAVEELEEASRLLAGDPEPLVLLAGAHAQRSRYRRSEAALLRAREAGYDPEQDPAEDPWHLYLRGLFLMAVGRRPTYSTAEDCMTRAVELEPDLAAVWHPLYVLRSALEDHAGAIEALRRHEEGLAVGDPYRSVLQALRLREEWLLQGDRALLEEALATLRQVEGALLADPVDAHAYHRQCGMLLVELGEPEAARTHLEVALDLDPDDDDARINLGLALTESAQDLAGSERLRQLDEAVELARRALESRPWSERGLRILAHAEFQHVLETGTLFDGSSAGPADRVPAILSLEREHPECDLVSELEAALQFHHGARAYAADENDLARACFEQCLVHRPEHFVAQVLAAEACTYVVPVDLEAAAVHYDAGYQLWMAREGADPAAVASIDDHAEAARWVRALLIGRTAVAARCGDAGRFHESRQAVQGVLDVHPFPEDWDGDAQRLTYAEALLLGEDADLREPQEARALFAGFLERWGETPDGWPPEFLSTIETIQARLH